MQYSVLRKTLKRWRQAGQVESMKSGEHLCEVAVIGAAQYRLNRQTDRKKAGNMAIGIFDSGLGGLTVLEGFRARLPVQEFVYFGDNANAPIGTRSAEEIYQITRKGCSLLFGQGCDLVILACNTASAVALKRLQEEWVPENKRVLGVFVPMIEVLAGRKWADSSPPQETSLKRVALFATPATIESRAFRRELGFRATGVDVVGQACPCLVEAIEEGDRAAANELVRDYVGKLLMQCPDPQAAVLGCTHYPLLTSMFRESLPHNTNILSQAQIAAEALADYLRRHPQFAGGQGVRYLTSGDPAAVSAQTQHFLGRFAEFMQA